MTTPERRFLSLVILNFAMKLWKKKINSNRTIWHYFSLKISCTYFSSVFQTVLSPFSACVTRPCISLAGCVILQYLAAHGRENVRFLLTKILCKTGGVKRVYTATDWDVIYLGGPWPSNTVWCCGLKNPFTIAIINFYPLINSSP